MTLRRARPLGGGVLGLVSAAVQPARPDEVTAGRARRLEVRCPHCLMLIEATVDARTGEELSAVARRR